MGLLSDWLVSSLIDCVGTKLLLTFFPSGFALLIALAPTQVDID